VRHGALPGDRGPGALVVLMMVGLRAAWWRARLQQLLFLVCRVPRGIDRGLTPFSHTHQPPNRTTAALTSSPGPSSPSRARPRAPTPATTTSTAKRSPSRT
jgi:hypothetical protein